MRSGWRNGERECKDAGMERWRKRKRKKEIEIETGRQAGRQSKKEKK